MEACCLAYYGCVFLGSLILSLFLTPFVRDQAVHRGWLDKPRGGRHLHLKPVPRIGGVALFFAFVSATAIVFAASRHFSVGPVLSTDTLLGILLPSLLVFLLGLYDDLSALGPYSKFGVEAIAAASLYIAGFGIHQLDLYSTHSALRISLGLPLTIVWVLLVTNAFNLIDGLDGLSAGSALFATSIIFVISFWRHSALVSLLTALLAGAILGFLRYNFHPATIFLGDSGSLLVGFLLSALALAGSQKATTMVAVAIPVVSFGLSILDVTLSVIRRFLSSKPLFEGDDEHIHHKLLKRGLSHRNAVLVLYAVAAAFGVLSLTLLHGEVMLGFVLMVIGLGAWWGVQQLKYLEFFELAETARRVRHRKRIIANNLRVRRAIESLTDSSMHFGEICRILQTTLEPLGFCGTAFSFPQSERIDESLLGPLRRDGKGRYSHSWKGQALSVPEWELKLELASRSGSKLGDLFISRIKASEPLWVDINLLNGEFRAAVSEAVNRIPVDTDYEELSNADLPALRASGWR